MASSSTRLRPHSWLEENGPGQLELLFRAVVFHPSAPVVITDNEGRYQEASSGAARLMGLHREEITGRTLDEFTEATTRPKAGDLWKDFLRRGEQEGTLQLAGKDGTQRDVQFTARGNVLPVRHVLAFHGKAAEQETRSVALSSAKTTPVCVQDYALFLLNAEGIIVCWYAGAERIFGYTAAEATGQHIALIYPAGGALDARLPAEMRRASVEGHFGDEVWCMTSAGSRFWGNVITMALRDGDGSPQGFAIIVRDFSERRERDEKLRASRTRLRPMAAENTQAGRVSGEFDHIPEANDAFLEMVGYSREDLQSGRLYWPDLAAPEFYALDELAHEECLRFGTCTPYEKELIRKDGTRITVLVATAVLKIAPFRWISIVQDISSLTLAECEEEESSEVTHDFVEIVGKSKSLNRLLRQIEVVAPTNATVLVLGETGTGKELVARAIHRISPRRDKPFVTLNCAAIPTGLLESELFGYERGAFTGALSQKIGRFEMANRGTLFLDEIGDISMDLQPKLLRALQEKSFERLGGTKTIAIDVRLVAATNRNLTQMMEEKLFRPDLYYRLRVFPVISPALRDRPEDIPLLARHFMELYAREMNKQVDTIPPETLKALVNWPWPGNVRELENFIERSVILSRGPDLRAPLAEIRESSGTPAAEGTLEAMERRHISQTLREANGSVSKAAIRLGVPRTTLNALMRKLDIHRADVS